MKVSRRAFVKAATPAIIAVSSASSIVGIGAQTIELRDPYDNNRKVQLLSAQVTFEEAVGIAISRGAQLASFRSHESHLYVVRHLGVERVFGAWIGGYRRRSSTPGVYAQWHWTDGSNAEYLNSPIGWHNRSSTAEKEDRVNLWHEAFFNDISKNYVASGILIKYPRGR